MTHRQIARSNKPGKALRLVFEDLVNLSTLTATDTGDADSTAPG